MANKLEIKSNDCAFVKSEIIVNGKQFPIKSLELKGHVDGVWTCYIEFYPKDGIGINIDDVILKNK